ncbi:MAG: FRG domain-containing protein, partial [Armatimonadota bacterium]|nr:FRG domain-containing protein [Armatimonadota bacterium]
ACATQLKNPTVTSWLHASNHNAVLSLGQHHELPTQYTDLTSNWRVAVWFATHKWTGAVKDDNKPSVIYRVDRSALRNLEVDVTLDGALKEKHQYKLIDLSSTPVALSERATNQSGWSLVRSEDPFLLQAMLDESIIDCITFPFSSIDQPHSFDQLTPSILSVAGAFHSELMKFKNSNHWRQCAQALQNLQSWPKGVDPNASDIQQLAMELPNPP